MSPRCSGPRIVGRRILLCQRPHDDRAGVRRRDGRTPAERRGGQLPAHEPAAGAAAAQPATGADTVRSPRRTGPKVTGTVAPLAWCCSTAVISIGTGVPLTTCRVSRSPVTAGSGAGSRAAASASPNAPAGPYSGRHRATAPSRPVSTARIGGCAATSTTAAMAARPPGSARRTACSNAVRLAACTREHPGGAEFGLGPDGVRGPRAGPSPGRRGEHRDRHDDQREHPVGAGLPGHLHRGQPEPQPATPQRHRAGAVGQPAQQPGGEQRHRERDQGRRDKSQPGVRAAVPGLVDAGHRDRQQAEVDDVGAPVAPPGGHPPQQRGDRPAKHRGLHRDQHQQPTGEHRADHAGRLGRRRGHIVGGHRPGQRASGQQAQRHADQQPADHRDQVLAEGEPQHAEPVAAAQLQQGEVGMPVPSGVAAGQPDREPGQQQHLDQRDGDAAFDAVPVTGDGDQDLCGGVDQPHLAPDELRLGGAERRAEPEAAVAAQQSPPARRCRGPGSDCRAAGRVNVASGVNTGSSSSSARNSGLLQYAPYGSAIS